MNRAPNLREPQFNVNCQQDPNLALGSTLRGKPHRAPHSFPSPTNPRPQAVSDSARTMAAGTTAHPMWPAVLNSDVVDSNAVQSTYSENLSDTRSRQKSAILFLQVECRLGMMIASAQQPRS